MIERFRRDENKKVNNEKVNELVRTGNRVLNILYILFIILLVYVLGLILKEWKIFNFIGKILSIISPLFIGWLIAWLLHPLVNKLKEKGVNKLLSVIITYVILLVIIYLMFALTLPSLGEQITDLVSSIPKIASDAKEWINNIFVKLSNLSLENLDTIKKSFFLKIETFASNIQTSLPEYAVNVVSAIASGVGKIALSLILGFYILFDFDKFSDEMQKLGDDMGMKIHVMHEDIFNSMHRI